MGKRNGEPYDPNLRQTDHGARLYNTWRKVRRFPHYEEWDSFPVFYNWAMSSGYARGVWLRRIDESKPYCPENCVWRSTHPAEAQPTHMTVGWADKWNRTVNRIRKHYGMPPLEGTDYGDI